MSLFCVGEVCVRASLVSGISGQQYGRNITVKLALGGTTGELYNRILRPYQYVQVGILGG